MKRVMKSNMPDKEQVIIDNLGAPELIRKRKAENDLFLRHFYFIQEGVKKYGLPEDCLFDAYSDTIMAGIVSIREGRFKEHCSVKTFLFQIFQFKCVDILRRKMTRKNQVHQTVGIDDVKQHITDKSLSVLEQLMHKSDEQLLKTHLKKLCNKSQRLLLLSVEGYSDKEIAKVMNFKTGRVVKTSRLRCIRKLRELNEYNLCRIAG